MVFQEIFSYISSASPAGAIKDLQNESKFNLVHFDEQNEIQEKLPIGYCNCQLVTLYKYRFLFLLYHTKISFIL